MENKVDVPIGYQPLQDIHGDAVECPECGSFNTWGDWESDISYDDGYAQLLTIGSAICGDCGHKWRL